MLWRSLATISVIACGLSAIATRPARSAEPSGDRYYFVVFAAEDDFHTAIRSHCFATFARFRGGTGLARPAVELIHINWFTRQGHETGVTRGVVDEDGRPAEPEAGENRVTRDALAGAVRHGLKVYRWGPYEIHADLFERARRHVARLEGRDPSYRILYKAEDLGYREGPRIIALNCVHAVSDVDRDRGPFRTGSTFGEEAGRLIAGHLARKAIDPTRAEESVWPRIWDAIWDGGPAAPVRILPRSPAIRQRASGLVGVPPRRGSSATPTRPADADSRSARVRTIGTPGGPRP